MIKTLLFISFFTSIGSTAFAETIAIIGGGASGLTSAWLLEKDYKVTLFEKDARLGGHADSVVLPNGAMVEAGFEFFSPSMFPHFLNLLKILKVETHEFELHYTFYKTDGSQTIALPPGFLSAIKNASLLLDFNRFLKQGKNFIQKNNSKLTLEKFVDSQKLNSKFKNSFLYPFLASMWGVSTTEIKNFAALPVVSWLVLNKTTMLSPPHWFEVKEGTAAYIKALSDQLTQTEFQLNTEVIDVHDSKNGYQVKTSNGSIYTFDHIVFASNAFTAKKLLDSVEKAKEVRDELAKIRYFKTYIAIHGDQSFMPQDKEDWGEVNVAYNGKNSAITVFKKWKAAPVFKTWVTDEVQNKLKLPEPLYIPLREYYHAIIDLNYLGAGKKINSLQGKNNLWFAGVYTGSIDSHESAILSAVRIAQKLAPTNSRLKQILNLKN